jgi:hypothetical protein
VDQDSLALKALWVTVIPALTSTNAALVPITVQRMPCVVILLVSMNASVFLDMMEMAKPVTMSMNALLVPTIVTKPSQIV